MASESCCSTLKVSALDIFGLSFVSLTSKDEKRTKVLEWLSSVKCGDIHEGLKKLRFEGTGEWLLVKPQYEDWIQSDSSSIIWLRGKGMQLTSAVSKAQWLTLLFHLAGSGKSVLWFVHHLGCR